MSEINEMLKNEKIEWNELLKILEIEDASEFENFEEFAALLECEEAIAKEDAKRLFDAVSEEVLEGLIKSYFDEIGEALPDSETESGVFLEIAVRMLIEKLHDSKEEFVEELLKFKRWYLLDSEVTIQREDNPGVYSFFHAIAEYRAGKLTGEQDAVYKFDEALNYKIDI